MTRRRPVRTVPQHKRVHPVVVLFVDTETTSTRPAFAPDGKRVWEFAAVVEGPRVRETQEIKRLVIEDVDITHADPESLEIGGYYSRHPRGGTPGLGLVYDSGSVPESLAAEWMADLCEGATIAAVNVGFDADGIGATLARHGYDHEPWNYHLIELGTMAATVLRIPPPWRSGQLARALGLNPDDYEPLHTAAADARLHCDIYWRCRWLEKHPVALAWLRLRNWTSGRRPLALETWR